MNKIGEFSRQFGLGTIAEALGVEFTAHKAADDAYATMKVAEAICKEEGLSLLGVLEKYGIDAGRIENYEVTQSSSVLSRKAAAESLARKEKIERARAAFHEYVDKHKRYRNKNGAKKFLSVSFSKKLEQNVELCKELCDDLFKQGGFYCFRADECNRFICEENETGPVVERMREKGVEVLTPRQLKDLLQGE
jgi:hypothetical protein